MSASAGFILYSRSYCHLCEDMLTALQALAPPDRPFQVEVVDVDADDGLLARFDELVPVLFGAGPAGPRLCHYFLDQAAVGDYLAAQGAMTP